MTEDQVSNLKFEDVKRAYNGKIGCMCGCLGDYANSSHYYSDTNDRKVKTRLNKLKRIVSVKTYDRIFIDDEYVSIEYDQTRNLTVYL